MGRNIVKLASFKQMNDFLFKFAYEIKEGIITVQGDSSNISFMNKASLEMLSIVT